MRTVVTAAQMAAMDRYTIETMQIPGMVLMENAGSAVCRHIYRYFGYNVKDKNILILCGAGNNGGDGFVIARHLINNGAIVNVMVLAPLDKIGGDARANLHILQQMQVNVQVVESVPDCLSAPELIVDAMLGTGVKGALRGIFAEFTEWVNQQACPVVAVDLPTGVNADTGAVAGPAVRAHSTITFALPKLGLLFDPGRQYAGKMHIADISMPAGTIQELDSGIALLQKEDIRAMLPRRADDAYKNSCGMAGVIAGSRGLTGAACLSSMAVMHAGAGLCYLASPLSLANVYESRMTEVVLWPLKDVIDGCLTMEHFDTILEKSTKMTAMAMGPGLGSAPETGELVRQLLKSIRLPLVLDADGLNHIAGHTELLAAYPADLVITPHPGEFARLTGLSTKEISRNRIELAREYSEKWGVVVLLKGAPTVVATPKGRVYINATGNAGMATAGSGDVLTGIIAGLLAQGLSLEQSALAGVYVHGLAGDLAAEQTGAIGMTATTLLDNVAHAIKNIKNDEI